MIKIFATLLFVISVVLSSVAAEVKYDFANNEFGLPTTKNTSDATMWLSEPIMKDGIVMTLSKGDATIGPLMYISEYNKTLDLRFYSGSNFKIATTTGEAIKSIAFRTNGNLDIVADSGDWGGENYSTWIGNAGEVSFSVNGKAQIYDFIVTTEAGSVICVAPTFTPDAGDYYESQKVSIECATEGATIHYTINGNVPTINSPIFNNPIEVNAETIIKAIGVKGESESSVAEAQYTFPKYVNVENLTAFNAQSTTTLPIRIDGDIVVAYQNAKYMYVKDDSGYAQVYGNVDQFYKTGDIIPAGIVGTWNNYGGVSQMIPFAETFKAATTTTTISPIEVRIADFNETLVNSYIIGLSWNLHITKSNNKYIYTVSEDSGKTLNIFQRFNGVEYPTAEGVYDITGIANIFNGTYQLYPIEFKKSSGVNDAVLSSTSITSANGEIIISAGAGVATIFNAAGSVVSTHKIVNGENRISIATGFYIVNVNNINQKVIVK